MMAQTDFQHIAGTRVAMDFVEVPSILMESFSKDPSILSTFGSHYQTGEGVPVQLIEASRRVQAQTRAFDDQHQILLATLDLKYHSAVAATPQFNSTRVFEQLQSQIMPIKHLPNCAWQVQFSHLFSYGCSYYSYLWSKRWASRIFATLFEGKQRGQWREGGEIFRNEVLRHGGGRDPWIGLEAIGVVKPGEREER